MAVLGKLSGMSRLFYKTDSMRALHEYLSEAMHPESKIYQRILSTRGENKIDLTDGMFAIEQSYETKERSLAKLESHIKYVDFQLVVLGEEYFLLGDKGDFTPSEEHLERDVIFYQAGDRVSQILLSSGSLAVFFDNDIHAGGLALNGLECKKMVYKSVVKVPKELVKLKF